MVVVWMIIIISILKSLNCQEPNTRLEFKHLKKCLLILIDQWKRRFSHPKALGLLMLVSNRRRWWSQQLVRTLWIMCRWKKVWQGTLLANHQWQGEIIQCLTVVMVVALHKIINGNSLNNLVRKQIWIQVSNDVRKQSISQITWTRNDRKNADHQLLPTYNSVFNRKVKRLSLSKISNWDLMTNQSQIIKFL